MQGGPEVEAVVKWYNPTKGFGFVAPADGTPDVFMHAEAVRLAGHTELPPGARLRVRVAQGQKGPQVTDIVEVDLSTAQAEPAFRPARPDRFGGGGGGDRFGGGGDRFGGGGDRFGGAPRGPRPDRFGGGGGGGATGERQSGSVKWYNPTKGFGFIAPEGGGTDVFVHATALERAGMRDLAEGQVLSFVVETDPRSGKTKAIDLRVD
jgi:CspA family cold shock protein